MISWHRVGQKVTMKDDRPWIVVQGRARGDEPVFGQIYTVSEVSQRLLRTHFGFAEIRRTSLFDTDNFRPVYPEIIDQLRNLDAPTPVDEHVKEDA